MDDPYFQEEVHDKSGISKSREDMVHDFDDTSPSKLDQSRISRHGQKSQNTRLLNMETNVIIKPKPMIGVTKFDKNQMVLPRFKASV